MARTATAAAVAGLAAAAAAWLVQGPSSGARQPAAVRGLRDVPVATTSSWQGAAIDALEVSPDVRLAASRIELAVIDTGADVTAPALALKRPLTWNVVSHSRLVTDTTGHGTLVASIAAGAADAAAGVEGVGGAARLLIVKATSANGLISPVAESAAIRYAVDHGARIINLSFAGASTSAVERRAIRYAVDHGVLLVAAAGNAYGSGNPVQYPAALIQPIGSNGRRGVGLVVGASDRNGVRAPFSSGGSWISLAAPGVQIAGAIPAGASPVEFPRSPLASAGSTYGYGSGTSFAAPQVAGAAALVWGVNPKLTAARVASILEATASGRGTWTPDLGYGVIDVGAAVALAAETR
jgi:subtilisin family serine protease